MAPAVGRLKTRPEFLRVAQGRRKWVTPGVIVQVRRRAAAGMERARIPVDLVRVGFTASRKVGGAVERNRARRRLRAACSEVMPFMGKAGYDYVLIARGETLRRPYKALLDDLKTALMQLSRDAAKSGGRRSGHSERAGRP